MIYLFFVFLENASNLPFVGFIIIIISFLIYILLGKVWLGFFIELFYLCGSIYKFSLLLEVYFIHIF
jgi:hypothetical protein